MQMSDVLININQIESYITHKNVGALLTDNSDDIIDPKSIENAEQILKELMGLKSNFNSILILLESKITNVKKIRDNELKKLNLILERFQLKGNQANTQTTNYDEKQIVTISKQPTKTLINVEGQMKLDAFKITDFSMVPSTGELCYIEDKNHFAIRINGILFHGNIGYIYINNNNPDKVKSCKFGKLCNKLNCNYYHDPTIYPNSKDVRNYIANSWLYSTSPKYATKSRRFGSKSLLEIDMNNLTDEEVKRFMDQAIHDILCCLLLKKYYKGD